MTAATSSQQPGFFDQFRLLTRYPNFGLLWTGQVISHLGDAFSNIALIWLVQEMTGSRTMMGAISATISTTALFGLVAGALVDRWDRRLTMFFSDVLRALAILTLPVLALLGQLELWHLFVVGAAMGLLMQLFYPAKQALLPHLVSRADLTSANALSHMAFLLLTAAGYGLGGLLLSVMTAPELFTFDAVTFGVSALTIWLIRLPRAQSANPDEEEQPTGESAPPGLWQDIFEGLRYVRQDTLLATVIPVSLIANFIFAPMTVLLAAWAKDIVNAGARGYGLLEGSFLIGSLVGTLSVNALTARFHRGKLVVWGVVFMGLPLVLFAFIPNIYLDAVLLAMMGLMNGIVNISIITVFQQRVPDAMMGRVFGLLIGLGMLAAPLGIALGGFAADYISLTTLFAAMGAAMALVGLSLFRQPAVAELA